MFPGVIFMREGFFLILGDKGEVIVASQCIKPG